jgi:alpha-L-fucosidase
MWRGFGTLHVGGFTEIPRTGYISVDQSGLDPYATVIALGLDGELDLYRGAGHG